MTEKLTFLYMDDDMLSGKIMELLITSMGHDITVFEESTDFLGKIAGLAQTPDVVLLDIHMEPFSGFEMIEMLRKSDRYSHLKVVALTASVMNEEISLLKTAGFDGVIPKPIDQNVFPELLGRILKGEKVWRVK